jgi:hypothetical protein
MLFVLMKAFWVSPVLAHAGEDHNAFGPISDDMLNTIGIVVLVLLGFRLIVLCRASTSTAHHATRPGNDPSETPEP